MIKVVNICRCPGQALCRINWPSAGVQENGVGGGVERLGEGPGAEREKGEWGGWGQRGGGGGVSLQITQRLIIPWMSARMFLCLL